MVIMLTQSYRFHGYGGLRYLYRHAQVERSHLITLKYVGNNHRRTSRVAVVVSKKVHKSAVGRNRIRRRLYEVIRYEIPNFTGVYDIAIIVTSNEIRSIPYNELVSTVRSLLTRANICSENVVQ